MRKKQGGLLLKVLSSAVILYLLFSNISFSNVGFAEVWKSIDLKYLALVFPVVVVVLVIKSFRWKLLIQAEGYRYSFFSAVKAYFSSFSLGVVTPGRLGELIKVYNLRKEITEIDPAKAFRTVVTDRLFDLFFLSWFGLSGVILYFQIVGEHGLWFTLMISLLIVFSSFYFGYKIFKFLSKKLMKSNQFIVFVVDCFGNLFLFKNIQSWIITGLAYLVFFLGIKFLFLSLAIEISILETGFIISLIGLVLLLPISVAGFGTREASFVYLLSIYGIGTETAIIVSILQFLTFFVWGGLVGLLFWLSEPIPLDILKQDSKKLFNLINS